MSPLWPAPHTAGPFQSSSAATQFTGVILLRLLLKQTHLLLLLLLHHQAMRAFLGQMGLTEDELLQRPQLVDSIRELSCDTAPCTHIIHPLLTALATLSTQCPLPNTVCVY